MNMFVRPSVNARSRTEGFTPVGAPRQPLTRIGFPSGVCGAAHKTFDFQRAPLIAESTKSGKAPKAVNHPDTGIGLRFCRYVTSFIAALSQVNSRKVLGK